MGKIARALLVDSITASPLFLLDELDKAPSLVHGENTLDVLLSLLEEENAQAFVDEYLGLPIRAQFANWIASANTTRSISEPLLDRMLVVEVRPPSGDDAKRIVRSIASDLIDRRAGGHVKALSEDAVAALVHMSARTVSRVVDLAIAFTIARRSRVIRVDDVSSAIELMDRAKQGKAIGFLAG